MAPRASSGRSAPPSADGFSQPPDAGIVSCFPSTACWDTGTITGSEGPVISVSPGLSSEGRVTVSPRVCAAPTSIFETLSQLHEFLGPLVDSLREDPESRALLTFLQDENSQLRARISRLESSPAVTVQPATPTAVAITPEEAPSKKPSSKGTRPPLPEIKVATGAGHRSSESAAAEPVQSFPILASEAALESVEVAPPPLASSHALSGSQASANRGSIESSTEQSRGSPRSGTEQDADIRERVLPRSSTASHSSTATGASLVSLAEPVLIDAPSRAFVINVRRLINAQETLALLHELIKSTAIAALTLVNAATVQQLRSTAFFLFFVILIFVIHDRKWDLLEVSDLRMLLPLLADDEEGGVMNPNRLLKALSFSKSPLGRIMRYFFMTCCVAAITLSWLVSKAWWSQAASEDEGAAPAAGNADILWILGALIRNEEDAAVYCIQVTVGSLMFILHLLFEMFYWNETCGVMPCTASGNIWDVRVDGLPWRYKLFGAPSMWFTSVEALEDLKSWIDLAVPTAPVWEIRPQEIAYYALLGDEERKAVQRALKASKLFDGHKREFVDSSGLPGTLLQLSIELCFFDEALQNKDCEYRGEFLCLEDHDHAEGAEIPRCVSRILQLAPRRPEAAKWMGWVRAPSFPSIHSSDTGQR